MMYSNVIVGITISRGSFVFSQSRVKVSTSLNNIGTRTETDKTSTQKDKRGPKTDDNWVRNISSRPLDKTETHVLSYGLKHSVTPKRIPTETIASSVEAVLSRQ